MSRVAVCSLAIFGAAGCAEPGVTQTSLTKPVKSGAKDAGTKKDAKAPAPEPEDDEAADETGSTDANEDDVAADDVEDDETDKEPVATVDAGKVDSGKTPDAGKKVDAGPAVDPEAVAECPSGYMCQDPAGPLKAMGLEGEVTDADGNPVDFACSKGQEMCDPKDPKKSCPNLPNAYCARVQIELLGVDIYNCAQKCEP